MSNTKSFGSIWIRKGTMERTERLNFFYFLFCGLLFSGGAFAANLSRSELIDHLRLHADILVMSDDGKQISEIGNETRMLSGFSRDGKFRRDWSSNDPKFGKFKLRYEWTIDEKGALHVHFEEFSEEEIDSKTGFIKDFKNPIGQSDQDVIDFGPVLYPVKSLHGKRVVLRFTPEISQDGPPEKIGKFKLMGHGISIYDSEGALWASDLELSSEYSAISTYRGTLVLSYSPFRGSEPAGVASGKRITLRMKDYPRVTLQSESDFVPEGMNARVFVKYLKDRRTAALNSTRQYDSSSEERLLERLSSI